MFQGLLIFPVVFTQQFVTEGHRSPKLSQHLSQNSSPKLISPGRLNLEGHVNCCLCWSLWYCSTTLTQELVARWHVVDLPAASVLSTALKVVVQQQMKLVAASDSAMRTQIIITIIAIYLWKPMKLPSKWLLQRAWRAVMQPGWDSFCNWPWLGQQQDLNWGISGCFWAVKMAGLLLCSRSRVIGDSGQPSSRGEGRPCFLWCGPQSISKAMGNEWETFPPSHCALLSPKFLPRSQRRWPLIRGLQKSPLHTSQSIHSSAVRLGFWWGGLQPVKHLQITSINVLTQLTKWWKAPYCAEFTEKRLIWLGLPSWGEKWQRGDYRINL